MYISDIYLNLYIHLCMISTSTIDTVLRDLPVAHLASHEERRLAVHVRPTEPFLVHFRLQEEASEHICHMFI